MSEPTKKHVNPKIIAIDFHDNDFSTTFTAFLRAILDGGIDRYGEVTKEKVAELWNRSCAGLYWLHQNKLEYRTDWDPLSYLKLEAKDILFDDEVKVHIDENDGWCNGETFVLDTQVVPAYVYSV
jgi:hypothetical protein